MVKSLEEKGLCMEPPSGGGFNASHPKCIWHHLRQTWCRWSPFEVHLHFNISELLTTTLKDLWPLLLQFKLVRVEILILKALSCVSLHWQSGGLLRFYVKWVPFLISSAKPGESELWHTFPLRRIQKLPVCIVIYLKVWNITGWSSCQQICTEIVFLSLVPYDSSLPAHFLTSPNAVLLPGLKLCSVAICHDVRLMP